MIMENIKILKDRNFKGNIIENADLKRYSFMHVGGYGDYLLEPFDSRDLNLINKYIEKYKIIGCGSNILFSGNYKGVLVNLCGYGKGINVNNEKIGFYAGCKLSMIGKIAYKNKLSGLENLIGIPGSIGGAIKMNAGSFGKTIFDVLEEVILYNKKSSDIIKVFTSDMNPEYRNGNISNDMIILGGVIKLITKSQEEIETKMRKFSEQRRIHQPSGNYSLGSIFKNPQEYTAGWLIDQCDLKDKSVGDAFVSNKHGNFILNRGSATAKDIIELINIIKDTVYARYKIKLRMEIEII